MTRKKYIELCKSVPFGMSNFQILMTSNKHEGDARKLRHNLLQLDKKLDALKYAEFERDRIEIDIQELYEKYNNEKNPYEKKRASIDIEQKKYNLEKQLKLIEDAEIECMALYKIIDKIEKPDSRKDFEKQEYEYWKNRLLSDAQADIKATGRIQQGTTSALKSIGIGNVQIDAAKQKLVPIEKGCDHDFLLEI